MANKRTPVPTGNAPESSVGEENPGAALEATMSDPDASKPAPEGKPAADTPLESPMPRSPTLDREEPPDLASEEDIGSKDDAPSERGAPKAKGRRKLKKPGATGSGDDRSLD